MDRLLDDPDLHDESLHFAMHLLRYRDGLFLFSIGPTSMPRTIAPNAIRPAVINRKSSGGNRTPRGAEPQAVIMSVLRTAKQRIVSARDAFTQMLSGPRAPHPFPWTVNRYGINRFTLRGLLGRTSTRTTERYARPSAETLV